MLPNIFTLKFAASALAAGGLVYAIGTDRLNFGGKFLGVFNDSGGDFGLDDVAKGAVILLAGLTVGRMLIKK